MAKENIGVLISRLILEKFPTIDQGHLSAEDIVAISDALGSTFGGFLALIEASRNKEIADLVKQRFLRTADEMSKSIIDRQKAKGRMV